MVPAAAVSTAAAVATSGTSIPIGALVDAWIRSGGFVLGLSTPRQTRGRAHAAPGSIPAGGRTLSRWSIHVRPDDSDMTYLRTRPCKSMWVGFSRCDLLAGCDRDRDGVSARGRVRLPRTMSRPAATLVERAVRPWLISL